MTKNNSPETCRIVLCFDVQRTIMPDDLNKAVHELDAACIILYDSANDEVHFQKSAEPLVKMFQAQGRAVLIAEDSRIAGRLKADGLHMIAKGQNTADHSSRINQNMIVGFGEIKDRHTAMDLGEKAPDYLMFGKLGADKNSSPHPRNLALGTWWAQMMEIPAIVQAGATLESVAQAAASGAEFVAIEEALFHSDDLVNHAQKISEIVKKHSLSEEEPEEGMNYEA